MRRIAALLVLAGLAVVAFSPFAESRSGSVKFVERLSERKNLAPFQVDQVTANCPSGYLAVAGMQFLGAIELVTSTSNGPRRGWTVAGGNPSTTDSYDFSAGVVCARGTGGVKVRKSSTAEIREAIKDWRHAHPRP